MDLKSVPVMKLSLEAFAIFLGVTAGFLAEDFREFRAERRQEQQALAQILRDLELDAADIEPFVEASRGMAEALLWIHNGLSRSVSADSVVLVINSIPAIASYEAANAAYAGLKAGGDLDLIRDPALLERLFYYFEDRQPAVEQLNEWALEADAWFWKHLAPYVGYDTSVTFLDPPAIVRLDLAGLKEDRTFRSELVWHGGSIEVLARDGQPVLSLNAELTEAVSQRLGVN